MARSRQIKQEKRIVKLMYRKGMLDLFSFEDLGWYDDYGELRFTIFKTDPWSGEGVEDSITDTFKMIIWFEGETDEDFHPIGKYPSNVDLINLLKSFPTKRNDNKINEKLKIKWKDL